MFGSQALETGLGLLFFFLLFSLVVTALADLVAAVLRLRAHNLRAGLRALLAKDLGSETENGSNDEIDDLIKSAGAGRLIAARKEGLPIFHLGKSVGPSSVDSRHFVGALLEALAEKTDAGEKILETANENAKKGLNRATHILAHADEIVAALPEEMALRRGLERALGHVDEALAAAKRSRHDLVARAQATREALVDWFDTQAAEIGDWYRERMKLMTFLIGLAGAIAINANPILVGQQLWAEPQFTAQLNQALIGQLDSLGVAALNGSTGSAAAQSDDAASPGTDAPTQDEAVRQIEILRQEIATYQAQLSAFPIGWTTERWAAHWPRSEPPGGNATDTAGASGATGTGSDSGGLLGVWISSLVGWSIAAFAATLGAPFWFDILKKIVALRSRVSQRNEEMGTNRRPTG